MRPRTDIKFEEIPEMVLAGMSTAEIATHFNTTKGSLKVMCSKKGVSLRRPMAARKANLEVKLPEEVHASFQAKARELKVHPAVLARRLIRTIVVDNLFTAVLDLQPLR